MTYSYVDTLPDTSPIARVERFPLRYLCMASLSIPTLATPGRRASTLRRCIAVDLMAHGKTEIAPDQGVPFEARPRGWWSLSTRLASKESISSPMTAALASQIFAVNHPDQLRTLTLTNGDVHDNWPPKDFSALLQMVANGGLPVLTLLDLLNGWCASHL
jgi:hypothetical protein